MDKELKTEFRLDDGIVLRAWREDDIDIALDVVRRNLEHLRPFMIWATPEYSIESARKFLTDAIANRQARKSLALGIFREDHLIGSIGFGGFDWDDQKAEIGYWLDSGEVGKGIMTRACQTLI